MVHNFKIFFIYLDSHFDHGTKKVIWVLQVMSCRSRASNPTKSPLYAYITRGKKKLSSISKSIASTVSHWSCASMLSYATHCPYGYVNTS